MLAPEKDKLTCPSFNKTGACIRGELCNKTHKIVDIERCLCFHNLYPDPNLFEKALPDGVLEIPNEQKQRMLDAFYLDIVLMLQQFGPLEDVVIAGNEVDHLSGNVLAMYREVDGALAAKTALDGQYYAGRRISITFSPTLRISSAICRSFETDDCEKGNQCNFIHPLNPSPFVSTECFPQSLRKFPKKFRRGTQNGFVRDAPDDLIHGRTKMIRKN